MTVVITARPNNIVMIDAVIEILNVIVKNESGNVSMYLKFREAMQFSFNPSRKEHL